ncbi:TspO/MBR family protein [Halorarius litoreus]|uniref:TspO/MBR family protein n=1 Tax=Halorarius litoreus TaxID=2962676 RepID=UPI0020CD28F1|nr:TspO/MBR family protein [Halorarius litoreus]
MVTDTRTTGDRGDTSVREFLRWDVLVAVLLVEAVGLTSGALTASEITGWYATLQQPALTPPNWVFGPVWTLLYALMGVSLALVWRERASRTAKIGIGLFVVQLALNFAWSLVFFGAQSPFGGLVVIVPLVGFILATIVVFDRVDRRAALLLVPYLLWSSFATYLTYSIWVLN